MAQIVAIWPECEGWPRVDRVVTEPNKNSPFGQALLAGCQESKVVVFLSFMRPPRDVLN